MKSPMTPDKKFSHRQKESGRGRKIQVPFISPNPIHQRLLFLQQLSPQNVEKNPTSESSPRAYISPHIAIATSCAGLSSRVRTFSTLRTTSMPSTTLPKTTCLPLRCGAGAVRMKNWQPLVLGPEF